MKIRHGSSTLLTSRCASITTGLRVENCVPVSISGVNAIAVRPVDIVYSVGLSRLATNSPFAPVSFVCSFTRRGAPTIGVSRIVSRKVTSTSAGVGVAVGVTVGVLVMVGVGVTVGVLVGVGVTVAVKVAVLVGVTVGE